VKDKRKYQRMGFSFVNISILWISLLLSEESNRSPHFTRPRRSFFKSRLQLNHVPVHETHSAKVRKITTTSKTPSLTRIGDEGEHLLLGQRHRAPKRRKNRKFIAAPTAPPHHTVRSATLPDRGKTFLSEADQLILCKGGIQMVKVDQGNSWSFVKGGSKVVKVDEGKQLILCSGVQKG
jgi:hypothetical protein